MPQLTLTTAGRTALAAASGADQINMNEVRLGTGRIAAGSIAAATALQTPISGAVFRVGQTGTDRSAIIRVDNPLTYQLECLDYSDSVYIPTEMGLFDADGNMISYFAAAAGANIYNKQTADDKVRFFAITSYDNALPRTSITYEIGAVRPASTDVIGIAELATRAEAIAGSDTIRVLTPDADKAALDARIASQSEVDTGTEDSKFITPETLAARVQLDTQRFTSSGTWTKPAGATMVVVELTGGGGGAAMAPFETTRIQYACGGGGAFAQYLLLADDLGATEPVVVGASGLGQYEAASENASNAGAGGTSSFGAAARKIVAGGGSPGVVTRGSPEVAAEGAPKEAGAAISEAGGNGQFHADIPRATAPDNIPTAAEVPARGGRGGSFRRGRYPETHNGFGQAEGHGGNIGLTHLENRFFNGGSGLCRVIAFR